MKAAQPDRAGWTKLLGGARFVPVVTIEHLRDAVPLARALLAGGLRNIEVTLRTAAALDSIAAITAQVPEMVVGAGTVMARPQIAEAVEAGAKFLVSPGTTRLLVTALAEAPVPALPGAATVSEAMRLVEFGFHVMKFFPAEASGGTVWLKNVAPVLPNVSFCPTGGVDGANMEKYLALPNVVTTGGAWVAPAKAVAEHDFETVTALAKKAAG